MFEAAVRSIFGAREARSPRRIFQIILPTFALVVLGVALATKAGGHVFDVRLSYVAQISAAAACVVLTGWRGFHVSGSQRIAWLAICGVALCDFVGCSANAWVEAIQLHSHTRDMPSGVTSLIGSPIGFLSIVMLARTHLRLGRSRAIIDGLIIVGSFFFAAWALVFGPLLRDGILSSNLLALSTPISDVGFALLTLVIASRARPEDGRPLIFLSAGLGFAAISDLVLAVQDLNSNFSSGQVWDVGWVAAFLLSGLAGAKTRKTLGPRATGTAITPSWPAFVTHGAVIFAAVGAVYALMFTKEGIDRVLGWDGAALMALLAIRQALAFRENLHLNADLRERTAELRSSEARFRGLVQNSSDAILVIDPGGTIIYVSPSADRVIGIPFAEMLGHELEEFVHGDDRQSLSQALSTPAGWQEGGSGVEFRVPDAERTWRHLEVRPSDMRDDPDVAGLVLNIRDVTERHELEEQLRHQAFHDSLTGLANRARFLDRLEHALARTKREGTSVGVVFIDLDNFKDVNDTLGHHVGDQMLVEVGNRLREALRTVDTPARLGGDEFAVLLEGDVSEVLAKKIGGRILVAISAPLLLDGVSLEMGASMGIAIGDSQQKAADLLRQADLAMYKVKGSGKARLAVFNDTMDLTAGMQEMVDQGAIVS